MEPELIDWGASLVLELVAPFSYIKLLEYRTLRGRHRHTTVLVLKIFPLWPYAFLEQMIIGLQREL